MNLLARVLNRSPGLARRLVVENPEKGRLGIDWIYEATREASTVWSMLASVRRQDSPDWSMLSEAYLPVAQTSTWAAFIDEAQEIPSPRPDDEWVAFVPAPQTEQGLILPDDSLPVLRVSLFTNVNGADRRVSIEERRRGEGRVSVHIDLRHCGLPTRARCDPGVCGSCRPVRVYNTDPAGYKCECPHHL
jgi:hypothetical protein